MDEKRKSQDDFAAAIFGEMKEDSTEKSAAVVANFLYMHYRKFIVAGFPEERAFQLCMVILQTFFNNIKPRKRK